MIRTRSASDFIGHIADAIERIQRYTHELTDITFLQSEVVQDAVVRNIEIIGEACNNITKRFPELATAHPELPLLIAYQMRNALAHGYFEVDLETVWRTVQLDLPVLHANVIHALETLHAAPTDENENEDKKGDDTSSFRPPGDG